VKLGAANSRFRTLNDTLAVIIAPADLHLSRMLVGRPIAAGDAFGVRGILPRPEGRGLPRVWVSAPAYGPVSVGSAQSNLRK
jgi:hypothetical protein